MAEQGVDEEFEDWEFEEDWEPWIPEPARYQIYVALAGHNKAMLGLHRRKRSK